ncbi:Short-chain dehydrogenase/reductase family 16C member 6 [Fasciola gigantica]|uniref:Short-chain dehydrogenase/reductase family 16C member 6 n=1 Tax=Fasciola gigantica TaxID=46835 RepID=A0A504Y750_FASGI|nr:Short-chain dehydrogenase/reductase family 16C member 6 [Fasciola gigantica]
MDVLSEVFAVMIDLFGFLLCLLTETLNNIRWWFFPAYKDLTNDVILVTGGGNGIGRLMCVEFAKYCPKVVAWDCQEEALKETARLVSEVSGHSLHTYVCDLRFREQIMETAKKVLHDVGNVTVLVNNAGFLSAKRLLDLQNEDLENTFKVNVLSHFHTIQAFLPTMFSAGWVNTKTVLANKDGDGITAASPSSELTVPRGHIVNITSVAGTVPAVGMSDYCASKAASMMMMDCLELELRRMDLQNSIHLTNVHPFMLNTQLFHGSQPLHQWLFPIIDASYCARRVVQAVRTNERTVFVSARFKLLPLIRSVLPSETIQHLYNFGGSAYFIDQVDNERRKAKKHED